MDEAGYDYLSRSEKMVLLALKKDIKTWRYYQPPEKK